MQENLERLVCYDCGAPFDEERMQFSCNSESGSGITIVTEEDMAEGEQVALTRRVYLDESKSQAIPAEPETKEGDGEAAPPAQAAWLLGPVGAVLSKDKAEALGLKEGTDFGEVPDARIAVAQQEMSNRATMRRSDLTMIMPGPVQAESTPERAEFSRETGGSLDEVDAEKAEKPAARVGSPSPMPQQGGGATPRASRA